MHDPTETDAVPMRSSLVPPRIGLGAWRRSFWPAAALVVGQIRLVFSFPPCRWPDILGGARQVLRSMALIGMCILAACGGRGGARQEDVTALRGLGFLPTPLVATPSVTDTSPNQVQVVFTAAAPLGQTVTAAPFVDTGSSEGALTLGADAIHIAPGSGGSQLYNSFQIYSVTLNLDIPTTAAFTKAGKESGGPWIGGQISYGIAVAAAGTTERAIAKLNVFPLGSAELAWQNPTISIAAPAANASVAVNSSVSLTAAINNPNGESGIVGWFVSNGQVSNRRAASTTWNPADAGPATITVVYHGLTSRGFASSTVDVTVTN